jgi:hypothetical protein
VVQRGHVTLCRLLVDRYAGLQQGFDRLCIQTEPTSARQRLNRQQSGSPDELCFGFLYLYMALVRRDVDRRQPLFPLLFVRVRAMLQQQPHLHQHNNNSSRQEVIRTNK